MRRRPPPSDHVPEELLCAPSGWPGISEWIAARQAWIDEGNVWPGGEVAEFSEVLEVLRAAPDEPWDGTGW